MRLWIFSSPTCVGLRYGQDRHSLEVFLVRSLPHFALAVAAARPWPEASVWRICLPHTSNQGTRSTNPALGAFPGVTPSYKRACLVTEYQPCVHRLRRLPSA